MSGLRGNVGTLRALEAKLRELPRVVALKVAQESAGAITELARATFAAGENAYGDAWAPGANGENVTLVRTGALRSGIRYVASGTRLRAQLGARHVKYQVGKRPVLPTGRLPVSYSETLRLKSAATIRGEIAGVR